MQYSHSAQALAQIGKKLEAAHLLDLAEQLFPGSTRIHRRALGLPEPGVLPPPASRKPLAMPPPAAPAPPPPLAPPPAPALPADLDMLIGLDLPGYERTLPAPTNPTPSQEPIALGDGLPLLPDLDALPPDPFAMPVLPMESMAVLPESTDQGPSELSWMDTTLTDFEPPPELPILTSAPTAPLAPMPTRQLELEVIEALSSLPELEPAPLPPVQPPTPLPEPVPAPAQVSGPAPEELDNLLGDIDFQLDYGSPEEAKIEIEAALKQFPEHPELHDRLERAEAALQKLGKTAKASALDEADFANSFFDLTDVLGTALIDSGEGEEMHDATHVVEKIQSVDELFSAFREGVEKQVKSDDYDTHYNLGIAYKEMILIDPAIEEFKIAMGDPERTLECCSMLSICEQARGDLGAAVEWLRQGILAPGFPPEDSIGLRYDLADIYLQLGHTGMASEEFKAVYEMDPDYRDVAARLA
jgi:tetratricopeptide (TPR) repeat protein